MKWAWNIVGTQQIFDEWMHQKNEIDQGDVKSEESNKTKEEVEEGT